MRVSSKKDIEVGKKDTMVGITPIILDADLLDASGSMAGGKYNNAIAGINEGINALKRDKNAVYKKFITEFSTDGWSGAYYGGEIENIPIGEITGFNGRGANGYTPLYEAIGYMINKLLEIKGVEDRVLLKIFTDGEENQSRGVYTNTVGGRKALYDLIQKVQKEDKFTITFMGTDQDTKTIIHNLGIERGNTLVHDNTAKGVKMSYMRTAGATANFAEDVKYRGTTSSKDFYEKSVEK